MTLKAREQTRRAFTIGEFSGMFGISRDSAKRHAKRGTLRTIMVGGRRLVPLSEVERIEKDGLAPQARTKKAQ